jgi:hypothetical protein
VPVSTETRAAKPLSLTQRSAQAITRLQEITGRSDGKLLAAAVAEAAVEEAGQSARFVRMVQMLYDALASTTKPANRTPRAAAPRKVLIPIVSAGEVVIGRDDQPDAYVLQRLYGDDQLRDALEGYTLATLREMAEVVMQRNPGTTPENKRTKVAVIDYIVACLTGSK